MYCRRVCSCSSCSSGGMGLIRGCNQVSAIASDRATVRQYNEGTGVVMFFDDLSRFLRVFYEDCVTRFERCCFSCSMASVEEDPLFLFHTFFFQSDKGVIRGLWEKIEGDSGDFCFQFSTRQEFAGRFPIVQWACSVQEKSVVGIL